MVDRVHVDPDAVTLRQTLAAAGRAAGLMAVGVARAEPFERTLLDLTTRRQRGLAADMAFTYLRPERSADPSRALPGALSVVVAAHPHPAGDPPPPSPTAMRVARYARRAHYDELRAGLASLAGVLASAGHRSRVLADDNAMVDREAAHQAGLGDYGRNANLLVHGHGSWFVLGGVVTDADLAPGVIFGDGPPRGRRGLPAPGSSRCGTCTRCVDACPTDAIVDDGVVDARRCLAWLAQAGGVFPRAHRRALGDRIYGCDICQEVCPLNAADRGLRPDIAGDLDGAWVDALDVLDADDDELLERHGRWYLARRDPDILRRNALIALGNGGHLDDRVRAALLRVAGGDRPVLVAQALWSARRLGIEAEAVAVLRPDMASSEVVRDELDHHG